MDKNEIKRIEENKIVQHNKLIASQTHMTGSTLKMFEIALGLYNTKDLEQREVAIEFDYIVKVFGLKKNYRQRIRDILGSMHKHYYTIKGEINPKTGRRSSDINISLVSWTEVNEDSNFIKIRFSTDVLPYIAEIKRDFTQYRLKNIAGLSKKYSIILYKNLIMNFNQYKEYKDKNTSATFIDQFKNPVMDLDTLRVITDTTNKYGKTAQFINRVISPSVEEINEKTDIYVEYEAVKSGRFVKGVKFFIEGKETKDSDDTPELVSINNSEENVIEYKNDEEIYDYIVKSEIMISLIHNSLFPIRRIADKKYVARFYDIITLFEALKKEYSAQKMNDLFSSAKEYFANNAITDDAIVPSLKEYVNSYFDKENNNNQEKFELSTFLADKIVQTLIQEGTIDIVSLSQEPFCLSLSKVLVEYKQIESTYGKDSLQEHLTYITNQMNSKNIAMSSRPSYMLKAAKNRLQQLSSSRSNNGRIKTKESLPEWAQPGYNPPKISEEEKEKLMVRSIKSKLALKMNLSKDDQNFIETYPELFSE